MLDLMNKSLLYIGNKLSVHGNSNTSIETLGPFLVKEGFIVIYASSQKNKILRLLDMIYRTVKYSKKTDYVLIDVYSTLNFWYALIISQLCRVLKLKYVAKLHGGELPSRLIKNPYLCHLIFNNAYKISAPSGYLYQAFKDEYSKNLVHIPNVIKIKKYSFEYRSINTPKLLWVRSFCSIYNPEMAIDVFYKLKKKYPDAQLCMVGPDKEGILENIKQKVMQMNLDVTFTGKLTKEEWRVISKDYNIFINTTHLDNTPVSVMEAMALGLPVVSTNVGGIPYLLQDKHDALLVNDNDVNGMVDCINELIVNNSMREFLVINAKDKVDQFDWEKVKSRWFEILK
jgi:L-malate glycosyltransferase